MQPFRILNISTQERRWVIFWGGVFVILTMIPYAIAMLVSDDTWHFFGVLATPQDNAAYLAKMRQGTEGYWLFELRYTPDAHDKAGLFLFYLLLGQISRILGLSTIVTFHLVRIIASLFMFTAFYQLGASVWQRERPRRLFFVFVSLASGLGWLAILFDPNVIAPDLDLPSAFPFYAAYTNPHLPITFGCLALLGAIFIKVFRPGYTESPTAENGGMGVIILTIILAIVQPTSLIILSTTLAIFVIISGYINKELPWHEMRWSSMVWLPVLPIALYLYLVFNTNDIMSEFGEQMLSVEVPNIPLALLGYGLVPLVALPGIIRGIRSFERDSDQFMVIWLLVNTVMIMLPSDFQIYLYTGLIIPLAFFVVRSLEDYWFDHIQKKWRLLLLILVLVLMLPSNVLALLVPLYGGAFNREEGAEVGLVIENDYVQAFDWLQENGIENEIVLAAPPVSVWTPAETNLRVVYGHPLETVHADRREQQVEAFYDGDDCDDLFDDDVGFSVDYVVWGPREEKYESQRCLDWVQEESQDMNRFGEVILFTMRELR